ncbi:hypothetical protein PIB30_072293 [Stylosanthes scabra]|uniref:Uncharacterized protein n=1 Tax=Stylosanthes scabra TaxID=79078 RepID=A0ABU6TNP6_9FABA|nr:hypothetical protein [Stylosanthes scabra]
MRKNVNVRGNERVVLGEVRTVVVRDMYWTGRVAKITDRALYPYWESMVGDSHSVFVETFQVQAQAWKVAKHVYVAMNPSYPLSLRSPSSVEPVTPHPPSRQRPPSTPILRCHLFTNVGAPSAAVHCSLIFDLHPPSSHRPSSQRPPSTPHLSLTPSIFDLHSKGKKRKKESSIAAPSVNHNLRRVLFTAIGAPSATAPCSLPFTIVATPSVALLLSACCRPPLFL